MEEFSPLQEPVFAFDGSAVEPLQCEVFDGAGIRRFKAERRFKAFYKRFIYKPEEKKETP